MTDPLHEIVAALGRARDDREGHTGAVTVLFVGPRGTGKTMAAQVLAQALGLDLLRIDLSRVVSKYIGETEKNLKRAFDEAEESGAVLLFDEADALFGRRSEVRDSHDRYAIVAINTLLERIEGHDGLVILATNRRKAIDAAFLRRLRFVVDFPLPAREPLMPHRHFGKYRATVVSTLDPMGLGRIQATVPAVSASGPVAWAMPCFPVSGMFLVPDIGSAVWIEFEEGDVERPVWTGCFYQSAAEVPSGSPTGSQAGRHFAFRNPDGSGLTISGGPGGEAVVEIGGPAGARITISQTGIQIDNGKGASITLAGPTVDVNNGALSIT